MKYLVPLGLIALLLAGCGADAEEQSQPSSAEPEKQQEAEVKDEKEKAEEESEEKQKNQEEVPEEPPITYEIQEDASLESSEETESSAVLVTIDDAPDSYSLEMAEYLKEAEVPAIFFVNGHFIQDEEGKQMLKEISDMGFHIGNHTMNHVNLTETSEEEQREEIVQLNQEIESITGEKPEFFRAPFGLNSDESTAIVEEEGMLSMNWTYGYDWEADYQDADALADIMVNTEYLRDGANLLMHDREWTKDALPQMVDGFRENKYEFIDPGQIETDSK
ncbi:polysaccharide deacetylase family protein [Alteribacillus sp. HJP-4]|uniref:polysaccharide deacetylase family protein n=1 Tax=Alteribacillus sp. HJP-4 TaxID=2775394 RepID=UPI0035CCE7F0